MSLSYWQRANREPDLEADIAIVGGGIIGCSAAWWLHSMQPELRVAVIDAGEIAGGASGRNAGFLLQGTSTDYLRDVSEFGADRARRLWHFTRENRDLIFSELRGRSFALEASGSLTVAGTAEEDERLRRCVGRMRSDGAPVAYIPPDETNRRLISRGFFGSLYVPFGAMLDPVQLVRHIVQRSEAQVLEHHRVLDIAEVKNRAAIETTGRRVIADRVLLAMNAYLPQLYEELGRYVRPVRAQMLATEPMMPRWMHVPAYSHEGYFYVRQAPSGAVLVGGARHLHVRDEVGYEDAPTPAVQHDLLRYLNGHFPQTQGLEVRRRWSGVMGFSPDGLPVVGEVPGIDGSFWAAGFTGHGMGYGFRFGRLLAELLLGQRDPEGLDLFSAARFAVPELSA